MEKLQEENSQDLIEQWKKEAKGIKTPEELSKFVTNLTTKYNHDYGTIVKAISAAMLAAFSTVDNSPQGGITGFQAGCVGWEMIREFMSIKGPAKLIDYNNLLYPQYSDNFEKSIDSATWEHIQKEAAEKIAGNNEHTNHKVLTHWKSIVDGNLPFGFDLKD